MTTQTNADSWAMMRELGRCEPFKYGAIPKTITPFDDNGSRKIKPGADLDCEPEPGEIRLNEFMASEAKRVGISIDGIRRRIIDRTGDYAGLEIRRVKRNLVFVRLP